MPKSILVIDDDPSIVMTTCAVLEAEGYTTMSALGTAEAVHVLQKNRPDLVLCDMMMESIDSGTDVIRVSKHLYPDVPVYLLSSISDAGKTQFDLDSLGFSGFFPKPVDPEAILYEIKKVLD